MSVHVIEMVIECVGAIVSMSVFGNLIVSVYVHVCDFVECVSDF